MHFSDGHLKCCRLQTMSDVVQWPMGHVQVSRCGCLGSSFRPPAGRPRLHAAADADVNISSSSSSPPFPPCSSPSSNQQTVPGAVLRTGCGAPRPSRPFLSLLWPSPYSDWQDVIHLGRLFTRNEDGEADQTPGQDTIRHGSRDPGRGRLESGDEMGNATVYTRRDGQRDDGLYLGAGSRCRFRRLTAGNTCRNRQSRHHGILPMAHSGGRWACRFDKNSGAAYASYWYHRLCQVRSRCDEWGRELLDSR